ncbi:MAG: CDP-diacylglycerol--serine O-phosphatidyltransferase [Chlorobiaceae bacterium]|nr:CDP-diacylglycerol--serine O-phosphatidyltransferase [Chlorobiales bacterium]NTU90761.1 CDP-diacylglycerol--serine O-phosphatidyltransferase [Chlorobiaceae bacterium]NTV26158.1 CDP-diacylglycerol--serine O-phosphatidyltransferase [Chlorobiaceae bacterium]
MGNVEQNNRQKRYPPVLKNGNGKVPFRFPFVSRSFVPSVFTVMNMVSGYGSIVMSSEGSYILAGWLIFLAAFFDTIDGFAARVTNGASEFGVELDSLSDLVSFGAAPAFLVYRFGLSSLGMPLGLILSSLLMVGSGLRLARFNISLIGYHKESFSGLPTPAQAMTIASFVLWMQAEPLLTGRALHEALALLTVVLAGLMVSKVNYDALPKPSIESFRRYPFQMTAYVIAIFCVLVFQAKAFFVAMLLYILLGIVRSLGMLVRQWQV